MTEFEDNLAITQEILGQEFIPFPRRELGAKDSAHGVVFGVDGDEPIAVKVFKGKGREQRANNELRITRSVAKLGIKTFEPIGVINDKDMSASLYVVRYESGLVGGHTLTYEAEPSSPDGATLALPVGAMTETLSDLHGHRVTHGDPRTKNFGFERKQIDGEVNKPYVFDFERGGVHGTKGRGQEIFAGSVNEDLRRYTESLGGRQFGGSDLNLAEDIIREVVVDRYLRGKASEEMGSAALRGAVIDTAQRGFLEGRQIYAKAHSSVKEKSVA